jgi:5S rRNA maturation endonuclease (ribonuclease M5)
MIDKVDGDALRYKQYRYEGLVNGSVWMGENWADFDQPLILVEGPFDLASVMRVYPNVVASFTSGLSVEKCLRLGGVSEIMTLYDYGRGGEAARQKISKVFKKIPVRHLIPTKEQDDPGNMTEDEIRAIIKSQLSV